MKMNVKALAQMPVHEHANLFPMMQAKETEGGNVQVGPLTRLAVDLEENGCHTPVVLFAGAVLDGRNRIAAAQLAGLDFLPTTEYSGDDPLKFVLSLNLNRRHLTKAQYGELALSLLPIMEAEAAERQASGTLAPEDAKGKAVDMVSEALNGALSARTIERVKAVTEKSPDLWKDVQRGARSITDAYNTMQGPKVEVNKPQGEKALALFSDAYDRFIDAIDRLVDAKLDTDQKLHAIKLVSHAVNYAQEKL